MEHPPNYDDSVQPWLAKQVLSMGEPATSGYLRPVFVNWWKIRITLIEQVLLGGWSATRE